uniref:Serine carboxypeptidase S28 family protein n=1 Tax=Setaria digitata TaxID=48799 RepID=A0A915PKD1_9BILA
MPTLSKTANKNSLLALFVVLYYYYIGISEAAIIKKSSSDNEPTVTFGSLESDMMDNLIAQKHSETGNEIKQSYPDVRSTWLSQPVDHFNKTDKRVFDQHYMYNIKFKSKSGVAFLKIGGTKEISDIELGVASRPFLIWARKYGAACFFLEHRFFGKSQPFNDISVESYKYLTIEQVMADMRRFIIEMNKIFFVNVAKPRWIIFGCSYTGKFFIGALAAWFRATNEDLTSAAIASSSVIQARVDNFDYVWNEENILKKENPKCSEAVRLGMQEIISKLYTLNGRKYKLQAKFHANFIEIEETIVAFGKLVESDPQFRDLCSDVVKK